MSAALIALIGGSALLQLVGGRFFPSAWLVPDLTLVAMTVAILREPDRAIAAMGMAGGCVLVCAFPHAGLTTLSYLGLGGLIAWGARQWDLLDVARQRGVVAASEGLLVILWMIADHLMSVSIIGWAIVRVAVTVACLPVARRFIAMTP